MLFFNCSPPYFHVTTDMSSMKKFLAALLFGLVTITCYAQNLTIFRSNLGVDETTTKIEEIIDAKGLKFFETVHHHEIATENGYTIDSTNVILFEDPELTSALIACEQTSALDLPLKVMVWEENEDVYIGFIDPAFMRKRFMIQDCPEILQKMTGLMVRVVNEAIRQR